MRAELMRYAMTALGAVDGDKRIGGRTVTVKRLVEAANPGRLQGKVEDLLNEIGEALEPLDHSVMRVAHVKYGSAVEVGVTLDIAGIRR